VGLKEKGKTSTRERGTFARGDTGGKGGEGCFFEGEERKGLGKNLRKVGSGEGIAIASEKLYALGREKKKLLAKTGKTICVCVFVFLLCFRLVMVGWCVKKDEIKILGGHLKKENRPLNDFWKQTGKLGRERGHR